jgi:predicted PurR-regulated permease PerM
MLQTSSDLLLISISLAVLWLTIFLCAVLYYLAAILRQIYQAIQNWKNRLEKIDEILGLIKEKIEQASSSLVLIAEGVRKSIEFLVRKQTKKKKK